MISFIYCLDKQWVNFNSMLIKCLYKHLSSAWYISEHNVSVFTEFTL